VGLVRRYGAAVALRGVDLDLRRGECVLICGPNGAGKTTLIRVLATLLRPSSGSLVVGGQDALRDPVRMRGLLGVVGHQTFLYGDLTPVENLRFYGRLYAVARLEARIAAVLEEVGIAHRGSVPVRTLSRGMQQRVALARAILHEPLILLLDEPETGLDDEAQERLAALIRDWTARERSVLITSHRIEWAARVADRAVVLREGRVAATVGPPLAPDALLSIYREENQPRRAAVAEASR
jgi:heme ABC exporter ATP-binding subunit CcmA